MTDIESTRFGVLQTIIVRIVRGYSIVSRFVCNCENDRGGGVEVKDDRNP